MTPVEILETAAGLVGGDRAKQHGDYRLLHQRVADLWSAYLKTDWAGECCLYDGFA